jgi:hypothetical protein
MTARPHSGTTWAGLAAGPGAWAVNLQVNYAGVPWMCGHHLNFAAPLSLALAAVALVGAFISWRAWRSTGGSARYWSVVDGRPFNFWAGVGALSGVLFALIILMQGAAGLFLQGCER